MTDRAVGGVVAGVDAHTDEHHVAVLDMRGRLLGTAAFPTTPAGYGRLSGWLQRHGPIERVGVESSRAYAAGLGRRLTAAASLSRSTSRTRTHGSGRRNLTRNPRGHEYVFAWSPAQKK